MQRRAPESGPVFGGLGSRAPTVSRARPPVRPAVVLVSAVLLPGSGQLLNDQAERGLVFVFFVVLLGWLSFQLTTPEHSFAGRYAGGLFVYCMAVLDAYKWARIRTEVHRRAVAAADRAAAP